MKADRFAAHVGVRLVEVRPGYARATLRLKPHHLNGVGVTQGGAIFTLADLAFAAASNSHGTVAVALDVAITFARAVARGTLTAEAREVSVSRKVSVCEVRVTDFEGVVALFHGTAYRLSDPAQPRRNLDGSASGPRQGTTVHSAAAGRRSPPGEASAREERGSGSRRRPNPTKVRARRRVPKPPSLVE